MKKLITLFTILTLALAVPIPADAAAKTNKRPVITAADKSVKVEKVKSGTYKTTLEAGAKKVSLKVKVSGKNVTKKCKWKSSNKKAVTVTKTGKLTAKKAGKANITVTYKKKKAVLKVTVKAKEAPAQNEEGSEESSEKETVPTCTHDWEPHYVTETAEFHYKTGEIVGVCQCLETFSSHEAFKLHLWDVAGKQALNRPFQDVHQRLLGKHGDLATMTDKISGGGGENFEVVTVTYADYLTCKLCGEKMVEDPII